MSKEIKTVHVSLKNPEPVHDMLHIVRASIKPKVNLEDLMLKYIKEGVTKEYNQLKTK